MKLANFALPLLLALGFSSSRLQGANSPFADAVAVWHLADTHDRAGEDSALTLNGDVQLGVELTRPERAESQRRGGDGKAAVFRGGWLSAQTGAGQELNLTGTALTLCVRLRDPSGRWDGPILSRHGGHSRLTYNLFATTLQGRMAIGFELGTDFKAQPLQVSFPIERLEATAWHDVIVRYSGPRLELFIDGVLVDEEWPAGQLRTAETIPCLLGAEVDANDAVQGRFHGLIDHAALWRRALSDEEIVLLSGGKAAIARNTRQLLGPEDFAVKEFWKPRGNLAVGDCMPFFDGQRWHLYYLQDRHGHRSKWGLGAHQWAHLSTADFKTWQTHPLAVPITDAREGSICTGSVFLRPGEYLAYYAVRTCDGSPAPLSLAVSSDGIHFTKQAWTQTLTLPYAGGPARDPNVFQDPRDHSFHMLVTTSLEGKTGNERGCLAHLVSSDLRHWEQRPPFLVPGLPGEPECAEWWEWKGWYYLVFSNGGVARYRMARDPLGPWVTPAVPAFDGNQCVVMKSAPFGNGRRIGAAFLPRAGGGYAGNVLFRELGQQSDGTLTTGFVRELMPKAGKPVKVKCLPGQTNSLIAGNRVISFEGLPQNLQLSARLHPANGTQAYGLRLRTGPENAALIEVRFLPAQQRIEVKNGAVMESVAGLEKENSIELFLKEDMLDLCLNNQRTLASRVALQPGESLVFFSEGGETRLERLEVRPLVEGAR